MSKHGIEIEYRLTQHDDGYRIRNWFRGGTETMLDAAEAPTIERAEDILRAAYLGPDAGGVEVRWTVFQDVE